MEAEPPTTHLDHFSHAPTYPPQIYSRAVTSQVAIVILLMGTAFAAGLAWFSWRLTRLPADSPDMVVGQLRLSQAAAVLLSFNGAIYAGLAAAAETTPGAAADVGIAGA